jgi:hypothetical protein
MHGPALGRFVPIFADTSYARVAREYVYATDERGTKTPPDVGRVRAYNPIIAAGVPDADYYILAHCDMCGRRDLNSRMRAHK